MFKLVVQPIYRLCDIWHFLIIASANIFQKKYIYFNGMRDFYFDSAEPETTQSSHCSSITSNTILYWSFKSQL